MNTLIKPLFRLTVVTFIIAMLVPVTTRADFCDDHPDHKNCQPPLPSNGFTVEVFFNFGPGPRFVSRGGPISNVVGKINGNRRNLGQNPMIVDITGLTLPVGCAPGFSSAEPASFTLSTARIPPSSPNLTNVTAGFGQIMPLGQEESFALRFDNGSIDGPETVDDWLPAAGDTTSLSGDTLTLFQTQSPGEAACNGEIDQRWKISVKNDD